MLNHVALAVSADSRKPFTEVSSDNFSLTVLR